MPTISLTLVASILLRIAALCWAIVVYRRIRDWRFGFLIATLSLMTLRQTVTLLHLNGAFGEDAASALRVSELPGLAVSALALLAVLTLGRMIAQQRHTERALRISERRYRMLFEASPEMVGIAEVTTPTRLGNWIEVNSEALSHLGYSRAEFLSMSPQDLLEDPSSSVDQVAKLANDERSLRFEAKLKTRNKGSIDCQLSAQVMDIEGSPTILFIVRDISAQKQLTALTAAAYERLAIAEGIAHVGSIEWRQGARPDTWSDETYRILGLAPGAVDSTFETFYSFVHPDDRTMLRAAAEVATRGTHAELMPRAEIGQLDTGTSPPAATDESDLTRFRIVRADGELRTLEVRIHGRATTTQPSPIFSATVQDVTIRERATHRLRQLTAHATLAEERERRRIADALHDRTIQNLGVCRFRLAALKESLASGAQHDQTAALLKIVTETIEDTRDLLFELSPPVLKDLGLRDAIDWLAEKMADRGGPPCEITTDADEIRFSDDVEFLLFRVARELLSNVEKHAQATTCKVSLDTHSTPGAAQLVVTDDGIGCATTSGSRFTPSEATYGLASLREAIDLIGGTLLIVPAASGGTRVEVVVPTEQRQGTADGAHTSLD